MFVKENDLKSKIQEACMENRLAQSYFKDLCQKKKVKGITLLDITKMEIIASLCAKGKVAMKVMQEMHDAPMARHHGDKTIRELLKKTLY
jgi:ArsR family metal-binding transcriptional regulator